MKQFLFFSVTLLFFFAALPAEHFKILSPKGGETWPLLTTQTISFYMDAVDYGPISAELYKDNILVGTIAFWGAPIPYQPGQFNFSWVVGRVQKPWGHEILVSSGSGYIIKVWTMDGLKSNWSNPFTILPKIDLDMSYFNKLKQLLSIPVIWLPDPGCPTCGKLDLSQLRQIMSGYPDPIEGSLFFNGQLIASLGRLGRGAELADSLQVRFTADAQAAIKRGGARFELRIVNSSGQTIHTQVVLLNQAR